MLPLAYPILLGMLVFVVVIEAAYLCLKLRTPLWPTVRSVGIANAVTTVLGFPLVWIIYVVLEFTLFSVLSFSGLLDHLGKFPDTLIGRIILVVLAAAWMGPETKSNWPVLLAFLVLLVPAFFLSAYVEAWILNRGGRLNLNRDTTRTIWQANVLSYVVLAVVGCVVLYWRIKGG